MWHTQSELKLGALRTAHTSGFLINQKGMYWNEKRPNHRHNGTGWLLLGYLNEANKVDMAVNDWEEQVLGWEKFLRTVT